MGAIAVHLGRGGPASTEAVQRMLKAAPHRGDLTSVRVVGDAAFGIVNASDWVTSSLAADEGRMAVFSGALDNQEELKAEMQLRDENAAHPSAADILLAGFGRWGEQVVARLRGSFAGAITDGRWVLCFRDQFGARPLYRRSGADGDFLATEIKQVLEGAGIRREPDMDYLTGIIFGGSGLRTAFLGVERVPKRSIVRLHSDGSTASAIYWDPSHLVETRRVGLQDATEGTVVALERAVQRQLTGRDVLLLSGGLDSPSVGYFAARANGLEQPVQAITATYPDYPSVDELDWTRMAADHVGMPLEPYVARAASLDAVEYWIEALDGPINTISIPEVAEAYTAARRLGARTVLNGEVAEFLFEGRWFLLEHALLKLRPRAALQVIGFTRQRGRSRVKIARDVVRALAPTRLIEARRRNRPLQIPAVPPWIDIERVTWASRTPAPRPGGGVTRWMEGQTSILTGEGVGIEVDEICGALCGVDPRRPFADVDLWEYVLSLPAEIKFPSERTKPLLRESMRGLLPDELIFRKTKTVFNEFHVGTADYPALRRILVDSGHRMEGVDYRLLADRLRAKEMSARELQWARDVARIHVFLNQWGTA